MNVIVCACKSGVRQADAIRMTLVIVAALLTGACGSDTVERLAPDPVPPLAVAQALAPELSTVLTVDLSGAQVIPAVDTRAVGLADFVFDHQTLRLHGVVRTSISDALSAHIHEGGVAEVGSIVVSLQADGNGQFSVPVSTFLTQSQKDLLDSGRLYIDVHGRDTEIRGQLSLEPASLPLEPTLRDIQARVFTPKCSGCHSGFGSTLPGVMDLSSEQGSYASLIGVHSISVDGLLRVAPGSAGTSFLFHKIDGSQSAGSRMPLRGARLGDQTITAIEQWIASGAPR